MHTREMTPCKVFPFQTAPLDRMVTPALSRSASGVKNTAGYKVHYADDASFYK